MSIPIPKNIFIELHENNLKLMARFKDVQKALEIHQQVLEQIVKHLNISDIKL